MCLHYTHIHEGIRHDGALLGFTIVFSLTRFVLSCSPTTRTFISHAIVGLRPAPLHLLRSQLSSNSGIARRFEAQVGDSQGLGCFFAPDETVPTPCDALVMKHCWSEEMRRKAGIDAADKEVFCCINSKWED